jgi:saccharopine dehydrogenase-like NADP-dependent oxidoreductase
MKTILVAGAGKSSTYLIQFLLACAGRYRWKIIVADSSEEAIADKIKKSFYGEKAIIDITNAAEREPLVKQADIVVSLMPPHLHIHLAKDCLKHKKHLITSSYISPEMKEMDKAVREAGLMFMCEMGLDPGIDHISASMLIHSIQKVTGIITSFKSYCGGLVAPESDDNPWHYKFSWNPRNVVSAGMGGAIYKQGGKEVVLPYEEMFEKNKKIEVDGVGTFAYYPNRDSLKYIDQYNVPEARTFLRATLRHPDFCKGWSAIVKLGLTNEKDSLGNNLSYAAWIKRKISNSINSNESIAEHVATKLDIAPNDKVISMLSWLGLFEETKIKSNYKSSADILHGLLLDKWAMKPKDKDMVVMQHEVEYKRRDQKFKVISSMKVIGEDSNNSAMAKTVGLPIGILAKQILRQTISRPPVGVLIPNMSSIYRPLITELRLNGLSFNEAVE